MEAGASKFSGLQFRIISSVVLAPLTLGLIILGGWYFMALILLAACIALHEWLGLIKESKNNYRDLFIGTFYLLICFISFVFIRLAFDQGAWLTLSMILGVWASDTGAYVVGKKIGKRKLAPKISPNKTIEGLGGAMFFFGTTLVLAMFLGDYSSIGMKQDHIWMVFVTGCLLGVVGQAGDLFISFFKRRAGVKDTGNLIPGHGGLLDRIDSLLLVSPVFLMIVMLWMG